MPPSGFNAKLHLEPGASKSLFIFLVCIYIVAIIIVSALPLAIGVRVLLMLVLLFSSIIAVVRNILLYGSNKICKAVLSQEDEWQIFTRNNGWQNTTLSRFSFVSPWIIILWFITGSCHRSSLVLSADNVDGNTLRRLNVRLRFSMALANKAKKKGVRP